jgi:hypothetical protein
MVTTVTEFYRDSVMPGRNMNCILTYNYWFRRIIAIEVSVHVISGHRMASVSIGAATPCCKFSVSRQWRGNCVFADDELQRGFTVPGELESVSSCIVVVFVIVVVSVIHLHSEVAVFSNLCLPPPPRREFRFFIVWDSALWQHISWSHPWRTVKCNYRAHKKG